MRLASHRELEPVGAVFEFAGTRAAGHGLSSLSCDCPGDGCGPCRTVLDEDRHIFSSIKSLADSSGLVWTALDSLNAAIGHVQHVGAGHAVHQLAGELLRVADAGGGEGEPA